MEDDAVQSSAREEEDDEVQIWESGQCPFLAHVPYGIW